MRLMPNAIFPAAPSHLYYNHVSSYPSELYSTPGELWTLLDTLAAGPPNIVALPSVDTGIHSPSEVNADSARARGFTEEAITVWASLPYLPFSLEIRPSTSPKC